MKIKLLVIFISMVSFLNSMDKPYSLVPIKTDNLEVIKNKIDLLYFVKEYKKSRNIPVTPQEEWWVDTYHRMATLMLETREELARRGRLPAGAHEWTFAQWQFFTKSMVINNKK